MTLSDWLTLLAIVLGPLFGVWLAGHLQRRACRRERRMDTFRTLMRTRRTPMWPDHVGALHLVEIEFAEDRNVIDAWRELFKHLGTQHARRSEETTSDSMNPEELASATDGTTLVSVRSVRGSWPSSSTPLPRCSTLESSS